MICYQGGGRCESGILFFCSIDFCYFFVLSLHFCICVISALTPGKSDYLVCVITYAQTQYMCLVEFKVNMSSDLPTRPWFLSLGSIWYGSRYPYGEYKPMGRAPNGAPSSPAW